MRIVHFDQMFHPEFGDQINVLPKYQIKQGHEVIIVTGKADIPHPRFSRFADNSNMDKKDKKFESETGVKIIRIDIKKFFSGRAIYKHGYKKLIDNLKPDILFCHYNDTLVGMHYTWISHKLKYPVIFDSHMLEMASENPFNKLFRLIYRLFLVPKIIKQELIVIRTQDDDYVNKQLGIPKRLTPFISFGTDTTLFYPNNNLRKKYREEYNIIDDDFVVVYTGKLTEGKGAKLLAKAFEKRINHNKNIILIVVGNSYGEYGKEIEELFARSENRIIRLPTQKYIDLPKFYQMSDLSVFPKQCSLSFYDAQACGLPVIAENNNINIDRLSHKNGCVFNAGDVEDFRQKISEVSLLPYQKYNFLSQNAYNFVKKNYDYRDIANKYTELLISEYKRFQQNNKYL